jgi:hypothetical protein
VTGRGFILATVVLATALVQRAAGDTVTVYYAPQEGDVAAATEAGPTAEGPVDELSWGYTEVGVRLWNRSTTQDHEVELILPAREDTRPYDYLARVSRRVHLPRHSSMTVSLYCPQIELGGADLAVVVDGKRLKEALPLSPGPRGGAYYYYSHRREKAPILVSNAVPASFRLEIERRYPEAYAFYRQWSSAMNRARWSDNWLGYGCYAAVVLAEEDVGTLSPQVLAALRRYAECGGMVVLCGGDGKLPQTLTEGGRRLRGTQGYAVGLGWVTTGLRWGSPGGWDSLASAWGGLGLTRQPPWATPDSSVLISPARVPTRGLFVVVLAFAVAMGPLNLYLLSRCRRQMWLWWNVPTVSIVTCLCIFAYSLASEGLTPRLRRTMLTILDENTHRATTIGFLSVYSPFTLSGGLRFGYHTEVNSLLPLRWYFSGGGRGRTVDWTESQRLASGWVVARAPAHFAVRTNEDRRERMNLRRESDGTLKVVNALGVDVRKLYLRDEAGQVYALENLRAGSEGTLKPLAGQTGPGPGPEVLRGFHASPLGARVADLFQYRGPEVLMSGCYLALCEKSPFAELPLDGAREEGGEAVVYGIFGSGNAATEPAGADQDF